MERDLTSLLAQCARQLNRVEGWLASLASKGGGPGDPYRPRIALVQRRLQRIMAQSPDVVLRRLVPPACAPGFALVAYVGGLVDSTLVESGVVTPLLSTTVPPAQWGDRTFGAGGVEAVDDWRDILARLTRGDTLVFAPGCPVAWSISTARYKERAISRPKTEMSVRGPDEAFTESITTQMAQIRRFLPRPDLKFIPLAVGKQQQAVAVAYIEGVTNPALVDVVVDRLRRVDVDTRPNATAIAGLIRDHPSSIFPTIRATERVGLAMWRLAEGKVLVLVDGDPFVLVAPAPLADFYRTEMDYAGAWYDASFVRLVRFVGWGIGVYLPALYLAATEVNLNVVPATFLISIAGSRSGMPASPVTEVLLMVLVIEMLREAAIRLPQVLGTTIGTVGAIVVGTAVVRAGIVSPQVIVLITLTALSFYTAPVYELTGTWRLVNFAMLSAATVLGLEGIVFVSMLLVGQLCRMSSFGVPYFEPWAPFRLRDWANTIVRFPYAHLRRRPTGARPLDTRWLSPPALRTSVHLRTGRSGRGAT
jgi:hypothetical protein